MCVACVFTPGVGSIQRVTHVLILRLLELVKLLVVQLGCLYLAVGMYLFIGLHVVVDRVA